MPKLWSKTIQAHRSDVRQAILAAASRQVARSGLLAVTMSQLATDAGIGRATLYKYFPNVESVLHAWHAERIQAHLAELEAIRDRTEDAGDRLRAVLHAFAHIAHESGRHDAALAGVLHRDANVARAQERLREIVRDLIAQGAKAKRFRRDMSPDELARYCLHAVAAASELSTKAALRRLVDVTMSALRP